VPSGSLQVVLDRRCFPFVSVVGILSGRPTGPTLAQQIPALVERNFNLADATHRLNVSVAVNSRLFKTMFLFDEIANLCQELGVVHEYACGSGIGLGSGGIGMGSGSGKGGTGEMGGSGGIELSLMSYLFPQSAFSNAALARLARLVM
jgi:hypothetical protein